MLTMRKRIPTGSLFHKAYKDRAGKTKYSRTWYVSYYADGRRIELPAGTENRDEALTFLRKKMADLRDQRILTAHPERVRMGQLFDMLLDTYKRKERRTTYDVTRKIEKENGLRARFGNIRAIDMTSALISDYIRRRQSEKRKPANATVNRELAYVRHAMRLGASQDPPLVARIPKFELLPEDNVREGTLTHEEYGRVRDLLPTYARVAMVIGYHTGGRKGEIRTILKDRIDSKEKRIELPGRTTKNKRPRYLPIYGDMAAEIEMAISTGSVSCPYLIQHHGKPVYDFEKAWKTACAAAGIPGALFHDLRRVAATNMIAARIPEDDVMKITGHRTRSMLTRYHILGPDRLQEIGFALEAHMREKEAENSKKQVRVH